MPEMLKHQYREHENELLGAKRFVYLAGAPEGTDAKDVSPEAKRQAKHAEELEAFFGKNSTQAEDDIKKAAEERDKAIEDLRDNWKGREFLNFGKEWKKYGKTDKKSIDETVTGMAEAKVKTVLEGINGENHEFVDLHTKLSLSILNAKADVLTDFKSALTDQIRLENQQKKNIEDAREAIKNTRNVFGRNLQGFVEATWGTNAFKGIDEKIRQYEEMSKVVETLTSENNEALGEKKEENKGVEKGRDLITKMILLRAPQLADELHDTITESVLKNDYSLFFKFLQDHAGELSFTSSEINTLQDTYKTFLVNDEGAKDAAYDMYVNEQKERGLLNRKGEAVKDRISRVAKLGDKKLKLIGRNGQREYQSIGVDRKKKRIYISTASGRKGIIDYSRESEPFMTEKKSNGDLVSYKLNIPIIEDSTQVSLTSVEFGVKRVKLKKTA